MEDRYKVRTGLSFGNIVAKYSVTAVARACWRPFLSKAALGLAVACFSPLADWAQAQSG